MKQIFTLLSLCFFFCAGAFSQALTGNKTIGPTGDYVSIKTAIDDLNLKGAGTGGVTFLLPADYTYTTASGTDLQINYTSAGTVDNQIIFKKDPATVGANPKIIGTGGTGTVDGVIVINGGKYITFDGIDIAVADASVEFGYYLRNRNTTTDGAQNNTIKNCKIVMDKTNTASVGINQNQAAVAASAASANSYNSYYNFTIENCGYVGIYLQGKVGSPTTFRDLNNTIGTINGGVSVIGSSSASDIGNANASGAAGIRMVYQDNFTVFNTEVRNVEFSTSSASSLGIFSASSSGTSVNKVYNNIVHDIYSLAANGGNAGIRLDGAGTTDVYNNVIYNIGRECIHLNNTGNYNVYFNSARLSLPVSSTSDGDVLLINTASTVNLKNNNFANFSLGSGVTRVLNVRASGANITSNNNNLYVDAPSATNLLTTFVGTVGNGGTLDNQTLAGWQNTATSGNGLANDLNSFSVNPNFTSATNLRPQAGNYKAGVTIAGITTDITGMTRFSTPSIGAYESPTVLPVTLLNYTASKSQDQVLLKWNTATEINNDHFNIKYSTDGLNWEIIATVKANADHIYTYIHSTPLNGANYYQLEQVDNDGKVNNLGVKQVNFKSLNEISLSVYPNPLVDILTIKHSPAKEGAKVKVVSVEGKVVFNSTIEVGSTQSLIDLSSLKKGIYVLEFNNAGGKTSVKILK
ncbi:T9SS type A sorting domain-containing protein [Pedobacter sp. SD-b]|uniref:T9SS type A sorting domain-containing protein n=1 Tax=Pedobacter segetis TaxID=2793069 RepID=A0ABS1BL06_9SPHI|nr:T9SS type A sorting domain-containing protein [Pedobacter segetis]MBK0383580.1 T9SS type A sorting domain-containing protein [Pedobacter segetis]